MFNGSVTPLGLPMTFQGRRLYDRSRLVSGGGICVPYMSANGCLQCPPSSKLHVLLGPAN